MSLVVYRSFLLAGCLWALSGCEDLNLSSPGTGSDRPATIDTRVLRGEVERTDIFSQTGDAVWDGRPTLGGRWVASTKTQDLERVRITRTDTGQSIEGALFRIEPGTPGPDLVISSDAAKDLGIVAGTPTPISVVALRQTQPAPAPTPEPEPSADPEAEIETSELAPQDTETTSTEPASPAVVKTDGSSLAPTATSVPVARTTQSGSSGSGLSEPEVQASDAPQPAAQPILKFASFATEEEADFALAQLAAQGLEAKKRLERSLFKKDWIVFSGPFENPADLVKARKAASEAGFTQAIVTVP